MAPDTPAAGQGIDLKGVVRHASYPGGTWRHVIAIGTQEIMVDSKVRHDAGMPVLVRVPAEALFVFPLSRDDGSHRQPAAAAA